MKISATPARDWAILIGFIGGPVLLALAISIAWGPAPWRPVTPLVIIATAAAVSGSLLLERAGRLQKRRTGRSGHTDFSRVELVFASLGAGCFVATVLLLVAAVDFRADLVFLGLAVAWVVGWIPPPSRDVVIRSTIEVHSTPQAAFDLVSDPNKWPHYVPEIELIEPVDRPVRLGSVVHYRVRRDGGIVVEGEEEVVVYEPGRRLGTTVRNDAMPISGVYEFLASTAGTRVERSYRLRIPLRLAIIGGRLVVRGEMKKASADSAQILQRIKTLLEEPSSLSV